MQGSLREPEVEGRIAYSKSTGMAWHNSGMDILLAREKYAYGRRSVRCLGCKVVRHNAWKLM